MYIDTKVVQTRILHNRDARNKYGKSDWYRNVIIELLIPNPHSNCWTCLGPIYHWVCICFIDCNLF